MTPFSGWQEGFGEQAQPGVQGRGVANGKTFTFPLLISLPARCSPLQPQSPSASCTPSPPGPRRHVENYCFSVPLEGRRTRALRLVAPPLRHLLNPWLAPLPREISKWTLRRSTSICRPSPAAAMALSFPQLVRRMGRAVGMESQAASPGLLLPFLSPSITRVSCGP